MNNIEDALKSKTKRKRKTSTVVKKVATEKESDLQKEVLFYFKKMYREQYPNCQIVVNPFSSFKMQPFQMVKAKEQGFKASQPDILFLQPNKDYIGLAIELKTLKANPYYKNNHTKLKKNKHVAAQKKYLDCLANNGYFATFGIGLEHCKKIIDNYFENM